MLYLFQLKIILLQSEQVEQGAVKIQLEILVQIQFFHLLLQQVVEEVEQKLLIILQEMVVLAEVQ